MFHLSELLERESRCGREKQVDSSLVFISMNESLVKDRGKTVQSRTRMARAYFCPPSCNHHFFSLSDLFL
jgi:hypothetical protein